jgi:hypothetical protein
VCWSRPDADAAVLIAPMVGLPISDELLERTVDEVVKHFEGVRAKGEKVAGQPIRDRPRPHAEARRG